MNDFRIVIGTVDGNWHQSDIVKISELQEAIDNGEEIWTGDWNNRKNPGTPEELVQELLQLAKYDKSYNTQTFTIKIDGIDRTFNTCHIVWYEVREV